MTYRFLKAPSVAFYVEPLDFDLANTVVEYLSLRTLNVSLSVTVACVCGAV